MGTSARSAVHRREPDPSSGLASRIGFPAPSCESHRRSRGQRSMGSIARSHAAAPRGSERTSRANTTIRLAAEYSGWQADRISRS